MLCMVIFISNPFFASYLRHEAVLVELKSTLILSLISFPSLSPQGLCLSCVLYIYIGCFFYYHIYST